MIKTLNLKVTEDKTLYHESVKTKQEIIAEAEVSFEEFMKHLDDFKGLVEKILNKSS